MVNTDNNNSQNETVLDQIYSDATEIMGALDGSDITTKPKVPLAIIATALRAARELMEHASEPLEPECPAIREAMGLGVADNDEDDGDGCLPEPAPRTFSKSKPFEGMTIARAGTLWTVFQKNAPRNPDELCFTGRCPDDTYSWWDVAPADVDYWHTHESHGRALAFNFLDFLNNPERDEDWDGTILSHVAEHMVKAVQADHRQNGIATGFWTVIGEYLTTGTADH